MQVILLHTRVSYDNSGDFFTASSDRLISRNLKDSSSVVLHRKVFNVSFCIFAFLF